MTLAIDIGGTNIRFAEIKGSRIKNKITVPTPSTQKEILSALISNAKNYNTKSVGISFAGVLQDSKVIFSPHLDLEDFALGSVLQKNLRTKIKIENDANCAALAEKKYGVAKKYKNFLFLAVGTGVGGAVFINNSLYKGNGSAGEFGHMLFGEKEFEELASGKTCLTNARQTLGNISPQELQQLAKQKDPQALRIYADLGNALARGIINMIYAFDPEVVILGGGISSVKAIYPSLKSKVYELDRLKRKTPILKSSLGDDAGLLGAALL